MQDAAKVAMTVPAVNPQTELISLFGRAILFIGAEARYWNIPQLVQAALYAKSYGFDSICVRRAEGTRRDYGTPQHLAEEYKAVSGVGVGYIPFKYSYGPRFGLDFVNKECAVLQEMIEAIAYARQGTGFAMDDIELEYDGRGDAAKIYAQFMKDKPGELAITTWGDPTLQAYHNVIEILKPVCNMWIPQEYNDFLARSSNDNMPFVQPGLDLSQEFGTNHPVAIAQNYKDLGAKCFFVWEYSLLGSQRANVRGIVKVAHS